MAERGEQMDVKGTLLTASPQGFAIQRDGVVIVGGSGRQSGEDLLGPRPEGSLDTLATGALEHHAQNCQ